MYCKLPTNGKQLPAFPLKAITGIEPRPQRWEAVGHFDCIVNIKGMLGKGYFCHHCFKGFNNYKEHSCEVTCQNCHSTSSHMQTSHMQKMPNCLPLSRVFPKTPASPKSRTVSIPVTMRHQMDLPYLSKSYRCDKTRQKVYTSVVSGNVTFVRNFFQPIICATFTLQNPKLRGSLVTHIFFWGTSLKTQSSQSWFSVEVRSCSYMWKEGLTSESLIH